MILYSALQVYFFVYYIDYEKHTHMKLFNVCETLSFFQFEFAENTLPTKAKESYFLNLTQPPTTTIHHTTIPINFFNISPIYLIQPYQFDLELHTH